MNVGFSKQSQHREMGIRPLLGSVMLDHQPSRAGKLCPPVPTTYQVPYNTHNNTHTLPEEFPT